MQESSSSSSPRRVDFDIVDSDNDDDVTIEHLKRSHPLRSSFLHGDPDQKATRSSTRSNSEILKKSSSLKSRVRPGECPVHGKKVTVIGSVPDVVIPISASRKNSSEESIVQPKSAIKGYNGTGVEKRQGWAGLQWALLVGCYALMLLLAVVVGVVLIHQHRISNRAAEGQSGTFPGTQLRDRVSSNSDLSQGPKRGSPGQQGNINNPASQVPHNLIRDSKSQSDGQAPSRTSRGRPKSLSSQEHLGNTFGSPSSPRQPKVLQANIPVFPGQQSSQPSLTRHQSRQPHPQANQRFPSSSSNNQGRGSSASQLPTGQSSFPGNQTRGSSFPRQQINQQTLSQQNIGNRGSSPPRSPSNNQGRGSSALQLPTRQSSFPGDQTRSSSFPVSSHQPSPNPSLSRNQQRNQSSFPNQRTNQPRQPVPNTRRPSSSPGDQTRSSSFPVSSHQAPNQSSSRNQQRNQPSFPTQRTNQPRQPVPNTRRPSSRQQQPHLQASQLPFNTNPSTQPHFPFEQLHRPASPDRTSSTLPNLNRDFTPARNSRPPGTKDSEAKIAKLWNHQNSDGSFTYGYVNTDGSFKNETRGIGGCVEGIYGYVDPLTNQQIRVPYQTGNTQGNSCTSPQPAWPAQTR